MGKYNKYFPKLDEKKKKQILDSVTARANSISTARSREGVFENDESSYDYSALQNKWEEKGINILDVVQFGPFSAREMLANLGYKPQDNQRSFNLHVIEALSERFEGAVVMNYRADGKTYIDTTLLGNENAVDLTDNFAHQQLTKWDKFWGFFGIKTDHAKDVMAHNAMINSTTATMNRLDGKIWGYENKEKVNSLLEDTASYETNTKTCEQITDTMKLWNEAFFGKDAKPLPSFRLSNGKEVDALSMCIAIYNKNNTKAITDIDFSKPSDADKEALEKAVNSYKHILKADYAISGGFGSNKFRNEIINTYLDKEISIPTENGKVTMESSVKAYPLLIAKSHLRSATLNTEFDALKDDPNYSSASKLVRDAITSKNIYDNLSKGEYRKAMDCYNSAMNVDKQEKVTDYNEFAKNAKGYMKNSAEIAVKAPEEELTI